MDKLIIKIKMPSAGSILRFDCPICQKSFSSGKGLGGHKRVHVRMAGKTVRHNRTAAELHINEAEDNVEKIYACPICQQPFPSDKSVHGHMRKHPERNWRGMRPPIPKVEVENGDSLLPASNTEGLLEAGNSSVDHQIEGEVSNVLIWERRSKHRKAPVDIIPETDKDSISVAYDLMALANGEQRLNEDFGPKKHKLELGNSGPPVLGGGYCFQWPEAAGNSIKGKNSMFVQKMLDKGQKKYVCNICYRPFRTYQALGGHKSHHILNFGESNDKSAAVDQRLTDQALGDDHLQCCSRIPTLVIEVPSCLGGDKDNVYQSKVFSFDLNELPPEKTDTAGDGGC